MQFQISGEKEILRNLSTKPKKSGSKLKKQMEINRQLEEIISWRFVTEFWRRFPKHFTLIEAHPGGGQYDCLALVTKGQSPQFAIDVNRGGGSAHIHKGAFGLGEEIINYYDWVDRMLQPSPVKFLDDICQEVRLITPKKLPSSTTETIVYRFIADFLTHSVGRLERWECRNGYEDTSEMFAGGKRRHLFEKFPIFRREKNLRKTKPFLDESAYNFWFLMKKEVPVLCLDTNGTAHRLDGSYYDLTNLYERSRRIWPLIVEVASGLLP